MVMHSLGGLASAAEDVEFFEAKVRPVLVEHCLRCHGDKRQKGNLRLDSKAGWEKGGDAGPALIPFKSKQSLLIKMISPGTESPPQMPPSNHLSPAVVADLARWIDMGAPDPRVDGAIVAKKEIDWARAAEFWAFKPVVSTPPPAVKDGKARQAIDRFVQAKLDEKGLSAAEPADRRTLIRRATFDLTGLPPTRVEVEAFLRDAAPAAFARVIDRLLASPHYGEHQARMWLDVVRYAEDQVYSPTGDLRPHAWRYRDWVIDAFNNDMPYDRFVKLQIAADLLEKDGDDPKDKAALGFFGLGAVYYKNNDIPRGVAEEADDRIDTLTRGFLGLTVSCARCHDHKYDPIPTQDYYSLAGVVYSMKLAPVPVSPVAQVQAYDTAKASATAAEKVAKEFLQIEKDRVALTKLKLLPDYTIAVWKLLATKLKEPSASAAEHATNAGLDKDAFGRLVSYLGRKEPANRLRTEWFKLLPMMGGVTEAPAEVRDAAEKFCDDVKANLAKPYDKRNLDIQQDWFGDKGVFPISEQDALADASASTRTEYERLKRTGMETAAKVPPEPDLAHGVVETKPTTLKVFLRGNPYKFGEPAPRRFLRIIAGENAAPFNASASGRLELADAIADPNNPLTARVIVNRIWQTHFGRGLVGTPSNFGVLGERPTHPELLDDLTARFIAQGWSIKKLHREIMLSETYQRSSTLLARNQEIDPENRLLWRMNRRRLSIESWRDALLVASGKLDLSRGGPSGNLDDLDMVRRSIYGKISRHDLSKILRLFDFPDANITSERRGETTVPQQMLFVINSPFMVAQAKALAGRINEEVEMVGKIQRAYWSTLGRAATDVEVALGTSYLSGTDAPEDAATNRLTRMERYAQALLASNEFVYVD